MKSDNFVKTISVIEQIEQR